MDKALAWTQLGDGPRVAWFLHGILGSGRNWRTFARRLAQRCPGWRFVMPDLRHHGDSGPRPSPHTLAACVADLTADLDGAGLPTPDAVLGHSFGGKVALEYARLGGPAQVAWVLDALPVNVDATQANPEVADVLRALQALPQTIADRRDARAALLADLSPTLVDWLLTSLRPLPDGSRWVWAWQLDAIEALLDDYLRVDHAPWLRQHAAAPTVHVVRAARNAQWSPAVFDRLGLGPTGQGAIGPAAHLHVLANAGHWLHVDNPDGLLDLIAPTLTA